MRKKKGDLSLSVNAIVVLVMAITMLGLGLAFIRSKFGSAGGLIDDVQQQVKDQITEDFASGDSRISFPKSTLRMKANDEITIAMGIKNDLISAKDFAIRITNVNSRTNPNEINNYVVPSTNNYFSSSSPGEVSSSNKIDTTMCSTCNIGFQFTNLYKNIDINDHRIVPIRIFTESASGTYFMRIEACPLTSTGAACDDLNYAVKEFFIEIV